ncbi:MAG: MBL fold metallo-hydrolase [Solirubrobacteraceae bacterium]
MAPILPPFVKTLPERVGRVSLPTPFGAGRLNCYLLLDRPITVLDPGALLPGSLDQIEAALGAEGLRVQDVEQIVVTHAHSDHFGAAATLAARSGAPIVCGSPEVPSLIAPRDPSPRRELLVALGVPAATAAELVEVGDAEFERAVTRPDPSIIKGVSDGELLTAGGRQLACLISPGHAVGHLSLWDPADRALFSGDHLLARIIPVPSLDGRDLATRRRSFLEYLDGLTRFVALDPAVVLPGHGRAFAKLGMLADRTRSHSRRRADEIAAILAGGPATPFEIAGRLQGQPEGGRLVLGIQHTQGHLDLLERDGRMIAQTAGEVARYRLRT